MNRVNMLTDFFRKTSLDMYYTCRDNVFLRPRTDIFRMVFKSLLEVKRVSREVDVKTL